MREHCFPTCLIYLTSIINCLAPVQSVDSSITNKSNLAVVYRQRRQLGESVPSHGPMRNFCCDEVTQPDITK